MAFASKLLSVSECVAWESWPWPGDEKPVQVSLEIQSGCKLSIVIDGVETVVGLPPGVCEGIVDMCAKNTDAWTLKRVEMLTEIADRHDHDSIAVD